MASNKGMWTPKSFHLAVLIQFFIRLSFGENIVNLCNEPEFERITDLLRPYEQQYPQWAKALQSLQGLIMKVRLIPWNGQDEEATASIDGWVLVHARSRHELFGDTLNKEYIDLLRRLGPFSQYLRKLQDKEFGIEYDDDDYDDDDDDDTEPYDLLTWEHYGVKR